MNRLIGILTFAALVIGVNSFGQNSNDETLLTINGSEVTKGEFLRIYMKNNTGEQVIDQKSLEEYLELFVNFKLKVTEAESLGLDTTKSFIDELDGYRTQLAKPYLVNQDVDNQLIREAYDRLNFDVKASHILIKLPKDPSPDDTLKAYNEVIKIRKKIMKGSSFSAMAKRYSEDPSAEKNGGNLGYFTGFQMVYPFESAAFNTPVGEVSDPVKTRFGYHLVKVEDKRSASGKVRVAHIMVAVPENSDQATIAKANAKINNIYNQLISGESSFDNTARQFSDDKASAARGGELPLFGTGKMVPEFENAAFSLQKVGDISRPVKTSYGFHIIKMLERQNIQSFEEMKTELKSRIQRDSRASKSKEALIRQLKMEYQFSSNDDIIKGFHQYVTDSILSGTWDGESAAGRAETMFTLDGKSYKENGFAEFLQRKRAQSQSLTKELLIKKYYDIWVDSEIIAYEDSRLESKYPDFRYLMNEYHDGILLFELSDRMVWTKAVKDTAGLKAFYEQHKTKFMWKDRLDISIYTLNQKKDTGLVAVDQYVTPNLKALKKLKKISKKRAKKGLSEEDTKLLMDELITKLGSNYNVTIEDERYEKGDHYLMDRLGWEKGLSEEYRENGELIYVMVNKVLAPQPKELKEIKGLITADYQNHLEAEWVTELREKYTIEVNQDVLKSIK
jgi:peptidyl-prolyl cis-trans isomerase SurA